MKIELDLNLEQMEGLEKDLQKTLSNLSEGQQIALLQGYINNLFEGIYRKDRWGDNQLNDFGQALVAEMREQISNATCEKILKDERFAKEIDRCVEFYKENLNDILGRTIIEYIMTRLFTEKSDVVEITSKILSSYRN